MNDKPPVEFLNHKIQIMPNQIEEIWIEPNMCFKIIVKDFDGRRWQYNANKGRVTLIPLTS